MARNKNGKMSGKLGDEVKIVMRNGEQRTRKYQSEINQSERSIKARADLGTASRASTLIRKSLKPVLIIPEYSELYIRLNKTMITIVQADKKSDTGSKKILPEHLFHLQDFYFAELAKVEGLLLKKPTVEWDVRGNVTVTIPELYGVSLLYPKKVATHIKLCAVTLSVNFDKETVDARKSEEIMQPAGVASKAFSFKVKTTPGLPVLVVLQIAPQTLEGKRYYHSVDKRFNAASVIDVLIPPAPQQENAAEAKKTAKKPQKTPPKSG
ncbi:hypothetical protein [Chitinophaga barathri]|uniref:Uncharacterized protein n=1 Tax=Chitinophaga barathri TaxID=1647451 RepID=A0A3N4MJ49_9BACT|nr:hypothetical protein [Chitinophaga barathri]RPD41837.1 hypothetical protein EG028_06640 [Chitinophaga barathri]